MPTGHTAGIENGMTFEEFVWSCARSFGALVMMRDDPSDAPIPKAFKPSTYQKEELERTEKEIKKVRLMSVEECEEIANKDFIKRKKELEGYIKKAQALRGKYERMLTAVNAWQPPSEDHQALKAFMIEQLQSSIEHDCDSPYYERELKNIRKPVLGAQWKKEKIANLEHDIVYYAEEYKKETERTDGRNKWISELRESLKK
jgi:hypothetical protein